MHKQGNITSTKLLFVCGDVAQKQIVSYAIRVDGKQLRCDTFVNRLGGLRAEKHRTPCYLRWEALWLIECLVLLYFVFRLLLGLTRFYLGLEVPPTHSSATLPATSFEQTSRSILWNLAED